MAPDLKASSSPPASDLVAACATRTLARTETFIPMNPVAPDRIAPTANPAATSRARETRANAKPGCTEPAERETDDREDHHADDADGGVLPLEIGLRALAHGLGNLLHPLAAGVGAQHRLGRPDAV